MIAENKSNIIPKDFDLGKRVILNSYSKRNRPESIDDFSDEEKSIRNFINENETKLINFALTRYDNSTNKDYKNCCKDWLEGYTEATIGKTYNLNTSTVHRVIYYFTFYIYRIAKVKIKTNANSLYCYSVFSNRSINWLSRKCRIESDADLLIAVDIGSIDIDHLVIYKDHCTKKKILSYINKIDMPSGIIKEIKKDKFLYESIQEKLDLNGN